MLTFASYSLWMAATIAGAMSLLLGFPIYCLFRKYGIYDMPNSRSNHIQPIVRGGGVCILVGIVAGAFVADNEAFSRKLLGLGGAVSIVALVSFWDDLRSLPAVTRFAGHFIAASAALLLLNHSIVSTNVSISLSEVFCRLAAVLAFLLWILGYTNAFNFMDGINGIAAIQAVITTLGMGLIAGLATTQWTTLPVRISFVVGAAALGFIPYNFPNARMFMGDVGSASLGFILAILVLWLASDLGWWLLVPLCLLHANFILDTALTLGRRILAGERWYEPHRNHFYQRLVQTQRSHSFVTLTELLLQAIVLASMILYIHVGITFRVFLAGFVIFLWLSFFLFVEISFRKTRI
jgi:Fuc2NAc and GlcNAc transferase